jgi:hypothetical protein
MAANGPAANGPDAADTLFVVINGGDDVALALPDTSAAWALILDTTRPTLCYLPVQGHFDVPAQSVLVFKPLGEPA